MKTELKGFTARLYTITGKSFLCPDDAPKEGTVIGFDPLQKVDPLNKFAFVVTPEGTVSVSRKFLKKGKKIDLSFDRPLYSTHNQEVGMMIEVMKKYLKLLEVSK